SGISFAGMFCLLLDSSNTYGMAIAIYFLIVYVLNLLYVLADIGFLRAWSPRVVDFARLFNSSDPVSSLLISSMLLNLGGLPPVLLFFTKTAAAGVVSVFAGPLVAALVLLSNVISVVVYLRILRFV